MRHRDAIPCASATSPTILQKEADEGKTFLDRRLHIFIYEKSGRLFINLPAPEFLNPVRENIR
jgi:hypothetical protein